MTKPKSLPPDEWLVSSDTAHHFTYEQSRLEDFTPLDLRMEVANYGEVHVQGLGRVTLNGVRLGKPVYYAPQLKLNLLSLPAEEFYVRSWLRENEDNSPLMTQHGRTKLEATRRYGGSRVVFDKHLRNSISNKVRFFLV